MNIECAMRKSLILFISLFYTWSLFADSYYCKEIGIVDGLSQSSVTCTIYDNSGSLWVGTRYGLNEYRNGKIRHFHDNYIYLLFCDNSGKLWFSSDKGLFCYDHYRDSYSLVDSSIQLSAVQIGNVIYFGGHSGLSSYNTISEEFIPGVSESYTDYIDLYEYKGTVVCVDRRYGIFVYYPGREMTRLLSFPQENLIMDAVMEGDVMYLSVLNHGIVEYNIDRHFVSRTFKMGENGLHNEVMLSLLLCGNSLWIGTDGDGIRILDLETGLAGEFTDIHHVQSSRPLPISVPSLYMDPHGNIWLGSVRSGLVGLKPSSIGAFSLPYPPDGKAVDNTIIWAYTSSDGYIYLGTDGNGVWQYDTNTDTLHPFGNHNGLKVTSISDYDSRYLLIATYNQGFFRMDRHTGELVPFIIVDRKTNSAECFSSNAPTIYKTAGGKILILAVHTYLYDVSSKTFTLFSGLDEETALELRVSGEESGGTVYAHSSSCLFALDVENCSSTFLRNVDEACGSVNSAVYSNGIIYIGSNNGVYQYMVLEDVLTLVTNDIFKRVSHLEVSSDGRLWVAANNTLFLYTDGSIEMIGENMGVPANEFLSSVKTAGQGIIFGGNTGFVSIGFPYDFKKSSKGDIQLHDLSLSGVKVHSENGYIRLPHNYSELSLTVNISESDPFDKVLYRYTMSGNSSFAMETFEDNISLPALKPGKYVIKACYLEGASLWSEPVDVLHVTVSRPWYASTAMIVFYILVGLVLISIGTTILIRRRTAALEAQIRARDYVFTSKLDTYISEHLSDPSLSVEDIAAYMAMSRATLYSKVNSAYGKGVAEIIDEKRMITAQELLKSTSLSVLEISERVGYSTSRYFSTRFKQLNNGITPLKYRQANQTK